MPIDRQGPPLLNSTLLALTMAASCLRDERPAELMPHNRQNRHMATESGPSAGFRGRMLFLSYICRAGAG